MFALNAGNWPVDRESPSEARDRYHRAALHEARIASDGREDHVLSSQHRSLIERVRIAVGLTPAEPTCVACPA